MTELTRKWEFTSSGVLQILMVRVYLNILDHVSKLEQRTLLHVSGWKYYGSGLDCAHPNLSIIEDSWSRSV